METPTNVSDWMENHGNITSTSLSVILSAHFTALTVAYIVIIVMSLFGNSVIIHIIRTRQFMRTATNYLILNQACADLIITVTGMPSMLGDALFWREWFEGKTALPLCHFLLVLIYLPSFCSIWSLAAIAADRYSAVACPLRPSPISSHIKVVIAGLWIWALVSAVGIASMGKIWNVNGDSYFCVLDFSHYELTGFHIADTCVLVFNITVPLVVMTIFYSIVCWRLWSRHVPCEGANQGPAETTKTAKKVTRMMIVVVVAFVLCWFPFYIFVCLNRFHNLTLPYAALKFVVWLSHAYSALNPYIYLSFNGKFRKEFKGIFGKCCKKGRGNPV